MPQLGFGIGGKQVGIDLGKIGALGSLFGGRPEDAVGDKEFQTMVNTGVNQVLAGERPTAFNDARTYLMKKGWGPKSASTEIEKHFTNARDFLGQSEIGNIIKENAAASGQMQTADVLPQDRDSMEQATAMPPTDTVSRMSPDQPEKPMSQGQGLRLMQRGIEPSKFINLMQYPGQEKLREEQMSDVQSQTKTRENILRGLEDLPDVPIAPGLPSQRKVAQFPSLANILPQRAKEEDPMLAAKLDELKSRTTLHGAQTASANARVDQIRKAINAANDPNSTLGQLSSYGNFLVKNLESFETPEEEKPQIIEALKAIRQRVAQIPGVPGGAPRGASASVQAGSKIRVKEKSTGRTGTLPANEFDPKLYERIQ